MAHGEGKLTRLNGDTYEGEWKNDTTDGYGIYKGKNILNEGVLGYF